MGVSGSTARKNSGTHSVDQVEHGSSTVRITTSKEAKDVSWVGYTLDSQAAGSTHCGSEGVEEDRAFDVRGADIASLGSTTGVDDSNSTAGGTVGELVVGVGTVLALGQCDLFRHCASLELLGVLVDGKTGVKDISDWEGNSLLLCDWCRGGKDYAEQSREREDSLDLHLEGRVIESGRWSVVWLQARNDLNVLLAAGCCVVAR